MSTDFKLRVPSEYYSGNSSKYSITQKYDIKRGHTHSVIVFHRKAFPQMMRLGFTSLDTSFLDFSPFREGR